MLFTVRLFVQREVARVDAQRERDVVIELATVQVISANYTARQIILEEQATADALLYTVRQQVNAYKALRQNIGLNTSGTIFIASLICRLFIVVFSKKLSFFLIR